MKAITLIVCLLFVALVIATPATPQQTISHVNAPLTNTELRASAVPVSGPLTDAQLRAAVVPVSVPGSVTVTDGSGPLTVDGTVTTTQPITTLCGNAVYDSGIVTLPNSTTVLTATVTCVSSITFYNLTASTQTVTVTDGQGSPANLIPPAFSLCPNCDVVFQRSGVKALAGIKWSASNAASVAGFVRGVQ